MVPVGDVQLPPELLRLVLRRLSFKDRLAFASAFPDLVCHVDASFGPESLRLFDHKSKLFDGLGRGEEYVAATRRMLDHGASIVEMEIWGDKVVRVIDDALYELLVQPATQASLTELTVYWNDHVNRPLFPAIFACTGLRKLRLVEISPEPAELPGFLRLRHLQHLDICIRGSVKPADLPLEGLLTLRLDFDFFSQSTELNQAWFSALPPMPELTLLSIWGMRPGIATFPWDRLPALAELEFKFGGPGPLFLRGAEFQQLRRLAWTDASTKVRVPGLLRALRPTTVSRLQHLCLDLYSSPTELKSSFKAMKQLRTLEELELLLRWGKDDTHEGTMADDLMRDLLCHLKRLRRIEITLDDDDNNDWHKTRLARELTVGDFFRMATSAPPPNLVFVGVRKYVNDFSARKGWMEDGALSVLNRIRKVLVHAARPPGLPLTVSLPKKMIYRYQKKLTQSKDPNHIIVSQLCRWQSN